MLIAGYGHDPDSYPRQTEEGSKQDQFGVLGDNNVAKTMDWHPKWYLKDGLEKMIGGCKNEGDRAS